MDAYRFSPSNFDSCSESKEGNEQTIYIWIIEMKDQMMENLKIRIEKKNCKENSITKKNREKHIWRIQLLLLKLYASLLLVVVSNNMLQICIINHQISWTKKFKCSNNIFENWMQDITTSMKVHPWKKKGTTVSYANLDVSLEVQATKPRQSNWEQGKSMVS
jgi:hypothetical protein